MNKPLKNKFTGNAIISIFSIVFIYLLISLYFVNHCFFNTEINKIDISLKSHDDVEEIIRSYAKDYKLQLIERNAEIEEIIGQDIGMQYNRYNNIPKIYRIQHPLKWLSSLLKEQRYYEADLFVYSKESLESKINELNCLNRDMIEPQDVSFKYSDGSYEAIEEVYGNRIYKDKLSNAIELSISEGKSKLDLNENLCYENPKYTLSSNKALEAKKLLDKYVSAKITYVFGNETEIVDGNIINQWLSVDENLEVVIDENTVKKYMQGLSKKYDTVGITRKFKTGTYKMVEVKGGFYGWKINRVAETKALLDNIKQGKILEKEPIYTQKAITRGESDIGNSYIEINITRQHLWFYKNGKLITQGAIVTGNPNKGNPTELGVYMLNYKEKGSTLRGPDYEAEVIYWMPFNGNIGIHDASWRYSFGGGIYKKNGTHGCVNTPLYLAKKIYDNIQDGTPVICYEE
jgi:hypothetical protein